MADIALTLTPNSPRNAEITSPSGQVLYKVVTEHVQKTDDTVTHLYNAEGAELASLLWGVGHADLVTIGDKPQMSMSEWMKKSIIPFQDHVSFHDDQGTKYWWKGLPASENLQLFATEEHHKASIARFEPQGEASAHLILSEHAAQVQDLVVISFVFLEKDKRFHHVHSSIGRVPVVVGSAAQHLVPSA
jgi:hypothetical protein